MDQKKEKLKIRCARNGRKTNRTCNETSSDGAERQPPVWEDPQSGGQIKPQAKKGGKRVRGSIPPTEEERKLT